ncbi:hypothetical protein R2601_01473 [Salipiger bermudensis HTCC2601]|uniref:Uncharacterized protein n=2 Tax=Salipiger TaxID=263377 RepID=Q0FPT7_SALBH|nr:hypothetical protein R2601_01473 [Salipiger bermudensis HTCC2601]
MRQTFAPGDAEQLDWRRGRSGKAPVAPFLAVRIALIAHDTVTESSLMTGGAMVAFELIQWRDTGIFSQTLAERGEKKTGIHSDQRQVKEFSLLSLATGVRGR